MSFWRFLRWSNRCFVGWNHHRWGVCTYYFASTERGKRGLLRWFSNKDEFMWVIFSMKIFVVMGIHRIDLSIQILFFFCLKFSNTPVTWMVSLLKFMIWFIAARWVNFGEWMFPTCASYISLKFLYQETYSIWYEHPWRILSPKTSCWRLPSTSGYHLAFLNFSNILDILWHELYMLETFHLFSIRLLL